MPRNSKAKVATNQAAIVKGMNDGKTQVQIGEELDLTDRSVRRNLANLRDGFQLASKEQFSEYVHHQVQLLTELAAQLWEGQVPPEVGNSIRGVLDSIARLTGSNAPTKSIHATVTDAQNIVFCLRWKWRKRSSVKIAERTYEEGKEATHPGRKSSHPEAASC